MNINDAAGICHEPRKRWRPLKGGQDATLDLADEVISAVSRQINEQEAAALAAADDKQKMLDFRAATYELEGCSINLRAYTRGMLHRNCVSAEIAKARAALDAMEAAS